MCPYTLMNISIAVYTFIQLLGSLEADFRATFIDKARIMVGIQYKIDSIC